MVTAHDDPALGGVYKLAALEENGIWRDTFKESASVGKDSWPGPQSIVRTFRDGGMVHDHIVNPKDSGAFCARSADKTEELHNELMRQGLIVTAKPDLKSAQKKARSSLDSLPATLRSVTKAAAPYPVSFDEAMIKKKLELMETLKNSGIDSSRGGLT